MLLHKRRRSIFLHTFPIEMPQRLIYLTPARNEQLPRCSEHACLRFLWFAFIGSFLFFFYFFCIFLFFLRCPPLNQLWFNAICLLVLWNYESGHSKCQHNATQKQKTSLDIWNTFLSPSSRSLWRINSICYGSSFASQCLAAQHFALAFDICRL